MSVANDQRPRILIVDDDPVMLCLVDDYLERHNMRAVLSSRALASAPARRGCSPRRGS